MCNIQTLLVLVSLSMSSAALFAPRLEIPTLLKELFDYTEDTLLDFHQLVGKYNFSSEEYAVTTSDGYILTLFHLFSPECEQFDGKPVLLFHGLLFNSNCWVDAGPDTGLGYLLAKDCRDVWLANNRGNNYGRAHSTLDPDNDAAFWDYCTDEMGYYDVPAHIDAVLNKTQASKVDIMGYSQGGVIPLIALSENPSYNEKINSVFGLAPAINIYNSPSEIMRIALTLVHTFKDFLESIGSYELLYKESIIQVVLEFLCQSTNRRKICYSLFALLDGYHTDSFSNYTLQTLYANFPGGVSLKQMHKYYQAQQVDDFSKYDYGAEKNLEVYGSADAPSYNLSAVEVPTVLITGIADNVVPTVDVKWAAERMPNCVVEILENYAFNHADVVYSQFVSTDMYPVILKHLNAFNEV